MFTQVSIVAHGPLVYFDGISEKTCAEDKGVMVDGGLMSGK